MKTVFCCVSLRLCFLFVFRHDRQLRKIVCLKDLSSSILFRYSSSLEYRVYGGIRGIVISSFAPSISIIFFWSLIRSGSYFSLFEFLCSPPPPVFIECPKHLFQRAKSVNIKGWRKDHEVPH